MPNKRNLLSAQIQAALTAQAAGVAVAQIPGRIAVRAAAAEGDPAELIIYGDIGASWWDDSVAASDVVKQLADIVAPQINVRINSYGGSVTDGLAIYNALKRHSATIVVTIDGIAASIASLIAMAGDRVEMPANALLMIHAPWTYAGGNSAELRDMADVLDVYGKAMATSYAAKSGMTYDAALALVSDGADHYYTAADALAAGLADVVVEDAAATDAAAAGLARICAQAGFSRISQHAPDAIAASLRTPTPTPAPAAVATRSPAANAGATQPDASASGELQEPTMPNATATNPAADPSAAATNAVLAAQRDRNTAILAAARPHAENAQIVALRDEALADTTMTVDAFNARAMAILGAAASPAAGAHTPSGGDEADKRRAALTSALESRLALPGAKADAANPFRGLSLSGMARACAQAAGARVAGMDSMDVIKAAITTTSSDFPLLLGNVVRRSVLAGYEAAEEVFPLFTQAVPVPDFRKSSLAALGHFSGISVVKEGGEYKYGQFDELGQDVQLSKSGAKFAITHEAIVNDDLGQLSQVPRKMGEAAKSELGDRVFALLTGNPDLSDGVALFHADHGNLVAPGTAITTATVDGVRVLMATQKTPSGKSIRVRLKYLVVPVGKAGTALTVRNSEFEVGAANQRNNTTPNVMRNGFEVLEDPRLDVDNPNAWYGIADPASVALIAVAYRDGMQEPTVEQKDGWDVDGVEFKVRLEAAPAIADYRGGVKNPGA